MKIASKVLKISVIVILSLILVLNLNVLIQSKLYPDKVPSLFGYKPFVVTTGSMESNINKGSIYIISEESGCHRFVRCISDYDKRTYVGNNIRNKYLNNEYNGLPLVEKIDFQELIHYLEKEIQ